MKVVPSGKYEFIKFRNLVVNALEKYSYTELSKESGVTRSTLYRFVDGTLTDATISTANKIVCAILRLEKKKKNS